MPFVLHSSFLSTRRRKERGMQDEGHKLKRLVALMDQCEKDTLNALGSGAAARLANLPTYETDLNALVKFIHDRLLKTRENGYALEEQRLLSLEAIAVRELPELFSKEDIQIASATLAGIV